MSDKNTSFIDSALDNPKDELQYALLKLQYTLMEICETLVEAFGPVVDSVCEAANSLYALGYSTEEILAAIDIMSPPRQHGSFSKPPQHFTQVNYTLPGTNRSRDEIRTIRRK